MSLKNSINKIFGKTKQINTQAGYVCGDIFGVAAGAFVGKFFVYIKHDQQDMHFITLPDMSIVIMSHDKFNTGVDNKILEYQETLPEEITQYCKEQYEKKSDN